MKALLSVRPGGPGTLELTDVPTPQPGKGELRVGVLACAINYPDVLIIEDKYQFKPPRPFAPGAEISGETLLILGAAGGIGLSAIEIGKAMGATVVAAVSSEEKQAAAKDAGADHTLVYGRGPFDKDAYKTLAQAFKDVVGPEGAHVIYDPVGGDYTEPALRSIAWEGRYLVVGFPAGIPKLPLNLTLLKACDFRKSSYRSRRFSRIRILQPSCLLNRFWLSRRSPRDFSTWRTQRHSTRPAG
jgi:NADPH:quinone reductase-like Zn-dependent oxidoreductase